MSLFIRLSLAYFVIATALNFVLRGDFSVVGLTFLGLSSQVTSVFIMAFPITIAFFVISWFTSPDTRAFLGRVARTVIALAMCCLFLAGFSSVKTLLPIAAEAVGWQHFFADPFFAVVDRALHFGVDPWVFTHAAVNAVGWTNFVHDSSLLYALWWAIPAFYLPAIIALLGDPEERARRYIILYFFSWIVLGNVVAFLGLSAGPIYYDRLFGTEVYADMHASLAAAGIGNSWFGGVQEGLWDAYVEEAQAIGSGISAFPSVHVAMITVTALYLQERHVLLGLIGWALFAGVLFVSVWTGYHYAIDGYASAIAVIALHLFLKRRNMRNVVANEANDAPSQLTPRPSPE